MSFENNDKKFERRGLGEERRFSQANAARPRFDKPRFDRPRPENVVRAIGDKDAAPQVAVGGLKEVEALLENEPLKVHRVLFMHQSKNPKLYSLQKLAKKAHVHVQQVDSKILDSYARPNQGVVALFLGMFAVNCTMPVTLYLANVVLPDREGLAFVLLAAALIPGYLFAFVL